MSPYLLGIDSGNTVVKAVVFDEEGRQQGLGSVSGTRMSPHPRWIEQDMDGAWENCRAAVRRAIDASGVRAKEIVGVGLAGHGDGLYLVDGSGQPVRPGILSMDSRAREIAERWEEAGIADRTLEFNGQRPFAASPPVLLTWLREHEPETLERTRWVLHVKAWLLYKLTGEIVTDPTEASSGFTDVRTQDYSEEAFSVYGLEEVRGKLPRIAGCMEVVGKITREVAQATGLAPGTPVVAGAHDVHASSVGVGCLEPGDLTVVAGTWSINEIISVDPTFHEGVVCRNFVSPGRWMNISASPASATNLDWFVHRLCATEVERAAGLGTSPFAFVEEEVRTVVGEESSVFYHPFLYGSPYGDDVTGGFFGLRGWHTRAHLLRALLEGIVFNHKRHVDILRSVFEVTRVRLAGGGSRSEVWSQMFADVLGVPTEVADAEETGALGSALCAGVGVGVYDSLKDATEEAFRLLRVHDPNPKNHERLAEAYRTYTALTEALAPVWSRLE